MKKIKKMKKIVFVYDEDIFEEGFDDGKHIFDFFWR